MCIRIDKKNLVCTFLQIFAGSCVTRKSVPAKRIADNRWLRTASVVEKGKRKYAERQRRTVGPGCFHNTYRAKPLEDRQISRYCFSMARVLSLCTTVTLCC